MSGTPVVVVGKKGRIVIPAEIRQRRGWTEGAVLVAVESDQGVILIARSELQAIVREQLQGHDLVGSLVADRRAAALAEDEM